MPFGRMVDRTGSRRPLIAGFGLGAAAVALLGFAHGGPGLLWRVCLLGLSYALILPAWNGLTVGKIDSGRRGLVLGLFMAIEGLGIASGSALGGTLYTSAFRAPFLATAGILAAMALFYGFVPREHFEARQEGAACAPGTPCSAGGPRPWREAGARPRRQAGRRAGEPKTACGRSSVWTRVPRSAGGACSPRARCLSGALAPGRGRSPRTTRVVGAASR
jgi:MFS family permease